MPTTSGIVARSSWIASRSSPAGRPGPRTHSALAASRRSGNDPRGDRQADPLSTTVAPVTMMIARRRRRLSRPCRPAPRTGASAASDPPSGSSRRATRVVIGPTTPTSTGHPAPQVGPGSAGPPRTAPRRRRREQHGVGEAQEDLGPVQPEGALRAAGPGGQDHRSRGPGRCRPRRSTRGPSRSTGRAIRSGHRRRPGSRR